jgi:hypothetical protein
MKMKDDDGGEERDDEESSRSILPIFLYIIYDKGLQKMKIFKSRDEEEEEP